MQSNSVSSLCKRFTHFGKQITLVIDKFNNRIHQNIGEIYVCLLFGFLFRKEKQLV